MSYLNIPAYEGSQPFKYVYYAEDDTRLALPVLARLYNEGMRMWSWNGCVSPNDVRASQRISSCAALLIFLSDNLNRDIDREYFEAMEALRCNKVKYFVRLSDVELPFDWGKSETNVVIDYARSNEAAFWLSIYDSEILERCRGSWPKTPVKAGLSAFDSVDSGELSDEYSNILKIIGESPALDRSGAPINAEDIALFAGAADEIAEKGDGDGLPVYVEDINNRSIRDLFGMLDEIAVSTRQRAEEIQQSAEKRRQEQEKAAMSAATLPFQHDVIPIVHSDEPPVPELSFTVFAQSVESAAAEMFGNTIVSEHFDIQSPEAEPDMEDIPIIDISEYKAEEAEPAEEKPSFEEFIDELAEAKPIEDASAELDEAEAAAEAYLPLSTQPKTVEIEEEPVSSLLPPAMGSLTSFTLPDDTYISTVYLENDEESMVPSAAQRAAAAEESRRQFESALENAAFKVTGRIVARHSKGLHSMGLKVKKNTKKVKPTAGHKIKNVKAVTVKPKPAALKHDIPEQTQPLSRVERRRHRRKSNAQEAVPEIQEAQRVSVTPNPVRIAPAVQTSTPAPKPVPAPPAPVIAPPAVESAPSAPEQGEEATRNVRKKRHPHNSSGLVGMLRQLRSQQSAQAESPDNSEDNTEDNK